jgi:hypothetical protein
MAQRHDTDVLEVVVGQLLTAPVDVVGVDLRILGEADARPTVDVNFNPLGLCQRQFLKKGCLTGARRDSKGFLEPTWIRHVDANYSTTA